MTSAPDVEHQAKKGPFVRRDRAGVERESLLGSSDFEPGRSILALFRRQAETARLNDELQFHLDEQIAENIAQGLSPEDARQAAMRSFGNPSVMRDQARSTWSWNWLEKCLRDMRYGARTLTRSPGFSLISILVMALGIGATTSLFTIVRAVLLKPLPFAES